MNSRTWQGRWLAPGAAWSRLDWLRNWYAQQCDGEWEHERGVRIATIDNPGWTVSIDLEESEL
ncbi:Imm53 family immunity protein [Streptomyces niveus]|uniref:Imm53 family immunity protein n=1 Tax=Streptomyces niveus TaxID=193462 RepID=UPI0036BBDA80